MPSWPWKDEVYQDQATGKRRLVLGVQQIGPDEGLVFWKSLSNASTSREPLDRVCGIRAWRRWREAATLIQRPGQPAPSVADVQKALDALAQCRVGKSCAGLTKAADTTGFQIGVGGQGFPDDPVFTLHSPSPRSATVVINFCPWCGIRLTEVK